MRLVVDASVAIEWLVPEPFSDAADRLLTGAHDLIAPDLLLLEAAAALWKKSRRGELSAREADAAMANLANGPIELWPMRPLIGSAVALARRVAHPVYDCIYLALAEREDGVVISADEEFRDQVARSPLRRRMLWIADAPG